MMIIIRASLRITRNSMADFWLLWLETKKNEQLGNFGMHANRYRWFHRQTLRFSLSICHNCYYSSTGLNLRSLRQTSELSQAKQPEAKWKSLEASFFAPQGLTFWLEISVDPSITFVTSESPFDSLIRPGWLLGLSMAISSNSAPNVYLNSVWDQH